MLLSTSGSSWKNNAYRMGYVKTVKKYLYNIYQIIDNKDNF